MEKDPRFIFDVDKECSDCGGSPVNKDGNCEFCEGLLEFQRTGTMAAEPKEFGIRGIVPKEDKE